MPIPLTGILSSMQSRYEDELAQQRAQDPGGMGALDPFWGTIGDALGSWNRRVSGTPAEAFLSVPILEQAARTKAQGYPVAPLDVAQGALEAPVDIMTPAVKAAPVIGAATGLWEMMGRRTAPLRGMAALDPSQAGKIGYHGSRHRWERPNLEMAGEGEGWNTEGWGFYVGSQPETGQFYRQAGANKNPDLIPNQLEVLVDNDFNLYQDAQIKRLIDRYRKNPRDKSTRILLNHKLKKYGGLDQIEREAGGLADDPGVLYTIDVDDEAIENMLDWDSPVKKQKKWSDIERAIGDYYLPDDATGAEAYWALTETLGSDKAASKALLEMGIPGNMYWDEVSRMLPDDQMRKKGTRNYVVFDEGVLKVIDKTEEPPGALDKTFVDLLKIGP